MTFPHQHKQKIQNMVTRFVAGTYIPRELDAIFLWLRSRTFGFKKVQELGDFVAHADEKDRGIFVKNATMLADMYYYVLTMNFFNDDPNFRDLNGLKKGVMAAFNLSDASEVKTQTGFIKGKSEKILKSALSKIILSDNTYCKIGFSPEEEKIFSIYSGVMVLFPAYNQADLFLEFTKCLLKNSLIKVDEIHKIAHASDHIAVYAIEKMHGCILKIGDNTPINLRIGISDRGGNKYLSIFCDVSIQCSIPGISWTTNMFDTTCNADDWATPSLINIIERNEKCWINLDHEFRLSEMEIG